jgi:hypothetical protein
MFAWINFAVLIFTTLFFLYFYFLSVGPAALEKVTGVEAYRRCGQYRMVAMIFEAVTVVNYVLYRFFPLSTIHAPAGIFSLAVVGVDHHRCFGWCSIHVVDVCRPKRRG